MSADKQLDLRGNQHRSIESEIILIECETSVKRGLWG